MKIAVSVESTCDLSKELIEKYNISVVPFTIILGDKQFYDGEISTEEIISYSNKYKILPKTSAVNCVQYDEHFEKLLKDNDAIIHLSLSSEMSSAYNNALRSTIDRENVFVIDSRTLSTGIGLLAIYARELSDTGKNPLEIVELINKRINYVQTSFELNRVDYLFRGGRCNALSYLGANLLKIRPQIIVKDGKMISGKKYRGNFAHVVNCYCADVLEEFNNPDLSHAFITYTTADQNIIDTAYKYLKNIGFKKIHITRAGGTITSHCGENCFGILYINDGNAG